MLTQGDTAAPITVGVAGLKRAVDHGLEPGLGRLHLAALPSVLMFFLMQKHFVARNHFGATKG